MQNKTAMQQFVIALLKDHLPENYYYHNYLHTLYVVAKAAEIGRHEHCTEKEMELLHAAALWHDTGYVKTYIGHEEESCLLAKKYLPGYGFNETDIYGICEMIMATKIPQSPKNKLEEMIADADLVYLGTSDAAEKATDLFKELRSLNPSLTMAGWNQMQIAFLSAHHYFTQYHSERSEPVKQAYLAQLKETAA